MKKERFTTKQGGGKEGNDEMMLQKKRNEMTSHDTAIVSAAISPSVVTVTTGVVGMVTEDVLGLGIPRKSPSPWRRWGRPLCAPHFPYLQLLPGPPTQEAPPPPPLPSIALPSPGSSAPRLGGVLVQHALISLVVFLLQPCLYCLEGVVEAAGTLGTAGKVLKGDMSETEVALHKPSDPEPWDHGNGTCDTSTMSTGAGDRCA